jgi:hypothetical protein
LVNIEKFFRNFFKILIFRTLKKILGFFFVFRKVTHVAPHALNGGRLGGRGEGRIRGGYVGGCLGGYLGGNEGVRWVGMGVA